MTDINAKCNVEIINMNPTSGHCEMCETDNVINGELFAFINNVIVDGFSMKLCSSCKTVFGGLLVE